MRLHTFAAIALFAYSVPVSAVTGYAHGADHCYYFEAPRGWTMDNSSGARDGVPMVFYPDGTTWQSAPLAMYTRPASSAVGRPDSARIAEQVNQVVEMYRSNSENIKPTRIRAIRSKAGMAGELWQFLGYSNGGAELVAYYPAQKTVNFFVMQVPQAASVGKHVHVLVELAESYRAGTDCKPCTSTGACKAEN